MRRALLLVVLLAGTLAGCSGSGERAIAPSPTRASDPPQVPVATAAPASGAALRGYAATYKDFSAAHQLNASDCQGLCFDGEVEDRNGTSQGKIVLNAGSREGTVVGLTIHFRPGTSISQARAEALALLPTRAKRIQQTPQGGCLTEVYRSQPVEDALGPSSAGKPFIPRVSFYSGPGVYDGQSVSMAILGLHELGSELTSC